MRSEDEIGDDGEHEHDCRDKDAAAAAAAFDPVHDARIAGIRRMACVGGEWIGPCRRNGIDRVRMTRIRYASGIGHGGVLRLLDRRITRQGRLGFTGK